METNDVVDGWRRITVLYIYDNDDERFVVRGG